MKNRRVIVRGLLVWTLGLTVACGDDDEPRPAESRDAGSQTGQDASAPGPATSDASSASSDGGRDANAAAPSADGGGTDGGSDGGPSADGGASAAKNVVEIAAADGRFKTLAKALTDANLVGALQGAGPFTVFAPTDTAFEALGQATLSALTVDQLTTILKYHVISGELLASSLKAGPVKTLSGLSAFVSTTGGAKINGATVTSADVRASNGVIHVIDKVLLPPNVVEAAQLAGGFTSLLAAATKANLASTLQTTQNVTVFAPTDAAFATLGQATVDGLSVAQLGDVLKYHVLAQKVLSTELVAGSVPTLLTGKSLTVSLTGGAKVNDANVVVADVVATNGVIHAVDKVLLPPQ